MNKKTLELLKENYGEIKNIKEYLFKASIIFGSEKSIGKILKELDEYKSEIVADDELFTGLKCYLVGKLIDTIIESGSLFEYYEENELPYDEDKILKERSLSILLNINKHDLLTNILSWEDKQGEFLCNEYNANKFFEILQELKEKFGTDISSTMLKNKYDGKVGIKIKYNCRYYTRCDDYDNFEKTINIRDFLNIKGISTCYELEKYDFSSLYEEINKPKYSYDFGEYGYTEMKLKTIPIAKKNLMLIVWEYIIKNN